MPVPRSMNCRMPDSATNRTVRTRNARFARASRRVSGATARTFFAASRSTAKLSIPPSTKSYTRACFGVLVSIPADTCHPWCATTSPPFGRRVEACPSSTIENLAEDVRRPAGASALPADHLHGLQVMIDMIGFVQVHGTGQVLDVHHVRQILIGEPQDAEPAQYRGMRPGTDRQDLQGDVPQFRRLHQPRLLLPVTMNCVGAHASAA